MGASSSVASSLTHLSPTDHHHNAIEPLNNTTYATLSTFLAMSWCYNDGRDAEEDLFSMFCMSMSFEYVNTNLPTAPGAGPSRSQNYANDESVSPKLSSRISTRRSLFCIPRTRTPTVPHNRGPMPTSRMGDT